MRILLLIPLLPFMLYASEPSAFSAGDLDSKNPYGLTESEKKIYDNKAKVRKLTNKFGSVDARIQNSLTSIEGMRDEVERNSVKTNSIERKLSKIENILGIGKPSLNDSNSSNQSVIKVANEVATLDSSKKFSIAQRLDKIEEYIKKSRTLQKQNYTKINSSLNKIARLTDSKLSKRQVKKIVRAEIKKYLDTMFKK